MNEFWTQTFAGAAAGVLVLLVQMIGSRIGKWSQVNEHSYVPGPTGPNQRGGNSVSLAEPDVRSPFNDGRVSETTVINNITYAETRMTVSGSNRRTASTETDPGSLVFLQIMASICAAALFAVLHEVLFGITLGIVSGLTASSTVAIVRTKRTLKTWPRGAVVSLVNLGLVLSTVCIVWAGIYTTNRGNLGVLAMQTAVSDTAADQGFWQRLIAQVVDTVKTYGMEGVVFLLLLLVAAVVAGFLLISVFIDVFGWHSFIGFGERYSRNTLIIRQAASFSRIPWWAPAWTVGLGAVTVACATGLAFDFIYELSPSDVLIPDTERAP